MASPTSGSSPRMMVRTSTWSSFLDAPDSTVGTRRRPVDGHLPQPDELVTGLSARPVLNSGPVQPSSGAAGRGASPHPCDDRLDALWNSGGLLPHSSATRPAGKARTRNHPSPPVRSACGRRGAGGPGRPCRLRRGHVGLTAMVADTALAAGGEALGRSLRTFDREVPDRRPHVSIRP